VKPSGGGRAWSSSSRKKEVSTSMEQPEHTSCPLALRDLLSLKQRSGEHLHSFTKRFTNVYLWLPQVSEAHVVEAFCFGTTNLQMIEQLTLSTEPVTAARLHELAHECANWVQSKDDLSGPSRYGGPIRRYCSRSPTWHPSSTQSPGESEVGSLACQG
jgi:hypothetical protein